MEGTPLSKAGDPERNFDTKKPKDKQNKFEAMAEDSMLALRRSHHIVREALRLEEDEPEEDSVQRIAHRAFEHRKRAPEAKQLHGEKESPERIGHVLITAEASKRREEESTPERIHATNKRIDTLSRPELLSLSEQIVIEGASLRQVYETHLIGEQALRRLIAEYFHGDDIQKALQREILEHEIDFERDPALRDMAVSTDGGNDDSKKVIAPGKEALNELLQRAGAGIFAADEEITYDAADSPRAHHKTEQNRRKQVSRQRQSIDIVMWVTIAVLIVLVLALYLWHH